MIFFEKTRIPLNIIDEIERGTIFTNRNHQLTYIRSYVRSYAKAIGIHEDDIVEALDQHQADRYEGLLAQKYLHSEPLTDNVPDQKKIGRHSNSVCRRETIINGNPG